MFKASCYSCRKKFEPAALRLSYSMNYCEDCGVGLFGKEYFSFPSKPNPTTPRYLAVHIGVLLFGVACVLLWLY